MTKINLEKSYREFIIFNMLTEDNRKKFIEMFKNAIKEKKELYEESNKVES